jgi:hypothetical protein
MKAKMKGLRSKFLKQILTYLDFDLANQPSAAIVVCYRIESGICLVCVEESRFVHGRQQGMNFLAFDFLLKEEGGRVNHEGQPMRGRCNAHSSPVLTAAWEYLRQLDWLELKK